jgi:hypothetical protein
LEPKQPKSDAVSRKAKYRDLGPAPEAPYRETNLQPEKRLMLAVLADAVKCLQERRPSSKQGKSAEAAMAWILSNRRDHPFCFQELCQALDWDPQQIRQSLVDGNKGDRDAFRSVPV